MINFPGMSHGRSARGRSRAARSRTRCVESRSIGPARCFDHGGPGGVGRVWGQRPDARETLADFETNSSAFDCRCHVFLGGLAGLAYLFKDDVIASSTVFVDVAGGPGILAAWFVLDLIPVPLIPHDIFATLGLIGDCGFWPTVGWASTAGPRRLCLLGRLSRLSHVPTSIAESRPAVRGGCLN